MNISALLSELEVDLFPVGDRVIVLPDEKEKVSSMGLVIPDTTDREQKQMGTVLAVGKGGMGKDGLNPTDYVEVGDRVLFGKYIGDDVELKRVESSGQGVSKVKVKILHVDSILSVVWPK